MQFRYGTQDKCYYDLLFPDIHRPRSVCRCMSGLHYDGSMNRISRERAVDLILREPGGLVIKPSVYTCGGEAVKAFAPAALTRKQVETILDEAGANFIVQDKVKEHPLYRKIAEDGPTTVRALSMLTEEGTYIPYMLLRVSPVSDQIVHYGRQGYYVAIGDDNRPARRVLRDYLKENGRFLIPPPVGGSSRSAQGSRRAAAGYGRHPRTGKADASEAAAFPVDRLGFHGGRGREGRVYRA